MRWLSSLLVLVFTLASRSSMAQAAEMADSFRSEGKIYVVVAIILIVLAGLIVYLVFLDRKLTRLERSFGREKTKERNKSF